MTSTLFVKYAGEDGIDQGALGKEFLADTLSDMARQLFPGGSPITSTLHVQKGNFETCTKIVAVSLSQGGPFPCFLEKCVYESMFREYNMQEIKDVNLTPTEQTVIDDVRKDPQANTDIILDSNYTGMIKQGNIDDICNSLKVNFINRRCLYMMYMTEFSKGLDSYSIVQLVREYPDICEEMFVIKHARKTIPDADYLCSLFQPKFGGKGTVKREVEEKIMDNLQDLLFKGEDGLILQKSSHAAWNYPLDDTDDTDITAEESIQHAEVTISSILGWFTGQRRRFHGPWEDLSI